MLTSLTWVETLWLLVNFLCLESTFYDLMIQVVVFVVIVVVVKNGLYAFIIKPRSVKRGFNAFANSIDPRQPA